VKGHIHGGNPTLEPTLFQLGVVHRIVVEFVFVIVKLGNVNELPEEIRFSSSQRCFFPSGEPQQSAPP